MGNVLEATPGIRTAPQPQLRDPKVMLTERKTQILAQTEPGGHLCRWLHGSALSHCAQEPNPIGLQGLGGGDGGSPHAGPEQPIWCHALRAEIRTGTSGSICPRRHCARLSSFSTNLASPKAKRHLCDKPCAMGTGLGRSQRPARCPAGGLHEGKGRGGGQGRINTSLTLQKHQREIMV